MLRLGRCERLMDCARVQVEVHRSPAHLLRSVLADGELASTAAKQVQGGSARNPKTPNHSVFLKNRISSSPFLAEPRCTSRAAGRRARKKTAETGVSSDMEDLRGLRPQGPTLRAGVGGEEGRRAGLLQGHVNKHIPVHDMYTFIWANFACPFARDCWSSSLFIICFIICRSSSLFIICVLHHQALLSRPEICQCLHIPVPECRGRSMTRCPDDLKKGEARQVDDAVCTRDVDALQHTYIVTHTRRWSDLHRNLVLQAARHRMALIPQGG